MGTQWHFVGAPSINNTLAERYPDDPEAKMILDFAAESTRGFTPRMTQDWHHKTEDKID